MATIECPQCKSDDVDISIVCDADGKLIQEETFGKCKKCRRKLSLEEIRAALGLK